MQSSELIRTMPILLRYPVIALERNAVEDYFKKKRRTTESNSEKVGSTSSKVEVKEEFIPEASAERSVKIGREVGSLVSSGGDVYPNKKPWISDLVVRIKKEKEDLDEVTYELVGFLSDHSVDKNQKPLLVVKRENMENENHHDDKTNISASNAHVGNKSMVVDAFEGSLNCSQIQSTIFSDSNSIKLVDASVMFKGSSSVEFKAAHCNENTCSCFYCQGEFRNGISARYVPKNQGTEEIIQCSDSEIESEKQNVEKLSTCNQSTTKCNEQSRVLSVGRQFECTLCLAKFELNDELNHHMKLHSNERVFKCKHCLAIFKSCRSLKHHLKIHSNGEPSQCNLCSKKFKRSDLLKRHLSLHNRKRTFKCNQCSAAFKEKRSLTNHFAVHSDERPFECEICLAKFKLRHSLKSHMKLHSDERPFECKFCQARFKRKHSWKMHMKLHCDESAFKCDQCSVKFKWKRGLTDHLKVHSDERPFECEFCTAKFRYCKNLKKHITLHTSERPFVYEHWLANYKKSKVLKQQMLLDNDNRPFHCAMCLAKFTQLCDLNKHMSSHSDERRFECKLCSAKFKRSCNLKNHLKCHSDEKPFMWQHCPAKFKESRTLRNHLSVQHLKEGSLEEPSKTGECPERFRNYVGLIKPTVSQKEERRNFLSEGRSSVATVGPINRQSIVTSPKFNDGVEPSSKTIISDELPIKPVGKQNKRLKEALDIEKPSKCNERRKTFENCANSIKHMIPLGEERSLQPTDSLSNNLFPAAAVGPMTVRSNITSPELNDAMEPSNKMVINELPVNLAFGELNKRPKPYPKEVGNVAEPSECDEWLKMFESCAGLVQQIPRREERFVQSTNSPSNDVLALATVNLIPCRSNATFELKGAMEPNGEAIIVDELPVNLPVGKLDKRQQTCKIEELLKCDKLLKTFESCCAVLIEQIPLEEEMSVQQTNFLSNDLSSRATVDPTTCRSNKTSPKLTGTIKPSCKTVILDDKPMNLPVGELDERDKPYTIEASDVEKPFKCDECLQTFDNCASLIAHLIPPQEQMSFQPTSSFRNDLASVTTVRPMTCRLNVTTPKLNSAKKPSGKTVISDEALVNLPIIELRKRLKPYLNKTIMEYYKTRRRTLKNRGYAQNCRLKRFGQKRALEKQNKALQAEIELVKKKIKKVMSHCTCRAGKRIFGENVPINGVGDVIRGAEQEELSDNVVA